MTKSLIPALALCAACYSTEALAPGDRALPIHLRFSATAAGIDPVNEVDVDCGIESVFRLDEGEVRSAAGVVVRGAGGGEARRQVLKTDGSGIAFFADTYFDDLEIHLIGADSIEIRSPASAGVTERFWREFARFAGNTRDVNPAAHELARGTWTCRPMDTPPSTGGYVDTTGIAPGSWVLTVTP